MTRRITCHHVACDVCMCHVAYTSVYAHLPLVSYLSINGYNQTTKDPYIFYMQFLPWFLPCGTMFLCFYVGDMMRSEARDRAVFIMTLYFHLKGEHMWHMLIWWKIGLLILFDLNYSSDGLEEMRDKILGIRWRSNGVHYAMFLLHTRHGKISTLYRQSDGWNLIMMICIWAIHLNYWSKMKRQIKWSHPVVAYL